MTGDRMAGVPRVGDPDEAAGVICAYSYDRDSPRCTEPATTHIAVLSSTGPVALAACDVHADIARSSGPFPHEHPFSPGMCGMRGAVWLNDGSACVADDGTATHDRWDTGAGS